MNILAREGEYGFVHTISTGVDHSASYTSASIFYKAPDGTVTEKTCDTVDASAGEYGWEVTDDFFTVGRWEAQLKLVLSSGVRKLKTPVVFWIGDSGEGSV